MKMKTLDRKIAEAKKRNETTLVLDFGLGRFEYKFPETEDQKIALREKINSDLYIASTRNENECIVGSHSDEV